VNKRRHRNKKSRDFYVTAFITKKVLKIGLTGNLVGRGAIFMIIAFSDPSLRHQKQWLGQDDKFMG